MKQSKKQYGSLNILAKSWKRDTNGLYDFSSTEIIKSEESINNSTLIKRNSNALIYKTNEVDNKINIPEETDICNVTKKENNNYLIENKVEFNMEPNEENIDKINNKLWYVVNGDKNGNNKNKDYFLTKNDIIKIGRVKYSIIEDSLYSGDKKFELTVPNNSNTINTLNSETKPVFNLIKTVPYLNKENKDENILCRICYSNESDINNPLIHLCNCKGGINYAHFSCIKHWMKTKLLIYGNKKRTVLSYFLPRFNCEICKAPYPLRFRLEENGDRVYELIDIRRPNSNYIIMESLDQIKEKNNRKYIHIIKIINQDNINIGRGIDADIRINDISVSKLHSVLNFNFETKSLLIKDCDSKFGTLVLIKNPFELKEKESLVIQSGRTLIKAKVNEKEKKKIFKTQKIEIKKENKNENNNIIKISLVSKETKEDINENEIKKENENIGMINNFEDEKVIIGNESDNNSIGMDLDIVQ